MDITPIIPKGKQVLSGYGAGAFKINNESISGSLLLLPDRAIAWDMQNFDPEHLQNLIPMLEEIDILLVGTGKDLTFIPPHIRMLFKEKNIAIDAMSTGAACRTYNVLLSEERRVAAALVAV